MSETGFQIFECQNPACRLRFPSNLTIAEMDACPFCGSVLVATSEPFTNEKSSALHTPTNTRPVSLLLDNLRSTFNVGSIFRTADGAGVSHIYCCGTTPTPEHPKIIKTGLGAEGFVPWTYLRNALDVFDLIQPGTLVYSLEAVEGAVDLFNEVNQTDSSSSVLLILGNEVSGIDPELMRRSERVLSLPMIGTKTSLNVAVAAGIAIYAVRFYTSLSL